MQKNKPIATRLWEDRIVVRIVWPAVVAGVFVMGAFIPADAPGQSVTAMHIGARVAPQCHIAVEPLTVNDDRGSAVRVTCGRQGFRALRVTSQQAGSVAPVVIFRSRELRAGAEGLFVVSEPMAVVASAAPPVLPAPPVVRQPVVITFDF